MLIIMVTEYNVLVLVIDSQNQMQLDFLVLTNIAELTSIQTTEFAVKYFGTDGPSQLAHAKQRILKKA
jgi:hypothetical protein